VRDLFPPQHSWPNGGKNRRRFPPEACLRFFAAIYPVVLPIEAFASGEHKLEERLRAPLDGLAVKARKREDEAS